MTDPMEPEVEVLEESTLTPEQQARVEALWQARGLLVAEGKVSAPFTDATSQTAIGRTRDYQHDLLVVTEYILNGLLEAELDEVVFDEVGCTAERCACKIAAEFTTGDGWSVPEPAEPDATFAREVGEPIPTAPPIDVAERELDAVRIATEAELYRHAQKQDVSLRDAWSYFRDQGYDMRDVGSYEFDSTNPNDKHNEIEDF